MCLVCTGIPYTLYWFVCSFAICNLRQTCFECVRLCEAFLVEVSFSLEFITRRYCHGEGTVPKIQVSNFFFFFFLRNWCPTDLRSLKIKWDRSSSPMKIKRDRFFGGTMGRTEIRKTGSPTTLTLYSRVFLLRERRYRHRFVQLLSTKAEQRSHRRLRFNYSRLSFR